MAKLTYAVLALMLSVAMGAWAPVYRFNNGVIQEGVLECPGDEWTRVLGTMLNATTAKRRLRVGGEERQLNHKCSGCGSACAYIGHGCSSSRRRRHLQSDDEGRRDLQSNACAKSVTDIDAALTTLLTVGNLSSTCQALLNAPRNVTCVLSTMNCHIDSISLWNAATDTLVVGNISTGNNGASFCRGPLQTFRADTNFNLGSVTFLLYGPQGYFSNRTATAAPYFMHESVNGDLNGTRFPHGNYNMTVFVDEDDATKKYYSFRFRPCVG